MTTPQIIITEDGSHTLFVESLNEHYHSVHGAIQESMTVFIQNGFEQVQQVSAPIHILEIGFGTGLNALLTLIHANKISKQVQYIAIEPFPIPQQIYNMLNYGEIVDSPLAPTAYKQIHDAEWNREVTISPNFTLKKISLPVEKYPFPENRFHLIYFDAFGPDKIHNIWNNENFKKCFDSLQNGGVFTTYSCKGEVRRGLKSVGFETLKVSGPIGKREILRAIKPTTVIPHITPNLKN